VTKAALEGLGLAFGVTESLIVEVESEVIDSMESRGPAGSVTSCTLWGVVASRALLRSMASATGPAVVALSGTASRTPEGVLASLARLHRVEGASGTRGVDMATRGRVFPVEAGAGLGWGTIDEHFDMSYEFF
jgi:hypothetical protein